MEGAYDFIVVGAGASGAVLASRLAHTSGAPSILLIEAGGSNAQAPHLSAADRFTVAFAPNSPLNWSYKTAPQNHLAGQEIDYSRGKGLGGSTAINFCGWTVGPRDDYDEWAAIVGHERFAWNNVRRVLKKIENLDPRIPDRRLVKWLHVNSGEHSMEGNLDLTYGTEWLPDVGDIFTAAVQSGHHLNPDVNSGNPIGMGMSSVCIAKGVRATSSSAYLSRPPPNLRVAVNAPIARVLFDGKKAVGIEAVDMRRLMAKKEIIICGGALNTPQILMLSGIGPTDELRKHGINPVHEAPMVGKNLQDHCFAAAGLVMEKDPRLPLAPGSQSPTPMGWFQLDQITSSSEFQGLPSRVKEHLQRSTVPAIEIASHCPSTFLEYFPSPSETYYGSICLIMNPQSTGTVTLRSSNPSDPPLIDPKFLTHPFDRRVLIEGIRETMRIHAAPIYASRTIKTLGPKDDSDEAIWAHIQGNVRSSWHMSGTACMGKNAEKAVVDTRFRVYGVENLRVVDLSVCPFVINAHVQSTAYILGEIGAEVLAEEYRLGEVPIAGKAVKLKQKL